MTERVSTDTFLVCTTMVNLTEVTSQCSTSCDQNGDCLIEVAIPAENITENGGKILKYICTVNTQFLTLSVTH